MARGIWRENSGSWAEAKDIWGSLSGSWRKATAVWANDGGTWKQVWPPVLTSTFNVVATSGEIGYTTSNITWSFTTGMAGSVTIQRKIGAGSWTDWITGQAVSGTIVNQLLSEGPATPPGNTYYYRAKFVPTHQPTWIQYSNEDSLYLSVPTVTFNALVNTTPEVYFTTENFGWSTGGSLTGTVRLQRKLGVGGTWTDFVTGQAKTGSTTGTRMVPAGSANSGTWYYRAVFTPTAYPTWDITSPERAALASYRSKGATPSNLTFHTNGTYNDDGGDNFWTLPYGYGGSPQYVTNYAGIGWDSGGFSGVTITSVSVSWSGADAYYAWFDSAESLRWLYAKAQDLGGSSFTCSLTQYARPSGGTYLRQSAGNTWASYVGTTWRIPNLASNTPTSQTWGSGFYLVGSDGASATWTFEDGEQKVVSIGQTPYC